MLVTTLEHGKHVVRRLSNFPCVAFDTETKPKPEYKNRPTVVKKEALIYGRSEVCMFSFCHKGEAYSFPTNILSVSYPSMKAWAEIIKPLFFRDDLVVIGHNAKYDRHVLAQYLDLSERGKLWRNMYDTMIGAWMADEATPKGLGDRASKLGRYIPDTDTINFTDVLELSKYNEEDTLATDELFFLQTEGRVERAKYVSHVLESGKLKRTPFGALNAVPCETIVDDSETLTPFEKEFLRLQEIPYLNVTIDAEVYGLGVDMTTLEDVRERCREAMIENDKALFRMAGREIKLGSIPQMTKLFEDLGIENPHRTKKGAMSFADDVMIRLGDAHPILPLIRNKTKLTKLWTTYISQKGVEHYVNLDDGRVHCSSSTCGAVTGRGGCSLPNLQNQPSKRDVFGLKKAYVA